MRAEPLEKETLKAALEGIVAMRKDISSLNYNRRTQISETGFQVNSIIQSFTMALCGAQIATEILSNHIITRMLLEKNSSVDYRALGVACIAVTLLVCVATLYFLVWRASRATRDDLGLYIKRNFSYLQNLSTISDLFTKFVVIAMLIYFQHPELVAPFLFLFLADYLIQGRYFTLSVRIAMGLAMMNLLGACAQFALGNSQVLWPLISFGITNALSLHRLFSLERIRA